MTTLLTITPLAPGYAEAQEPDQSDGPGVEGGHVQPGTEGMVIRVPLSPSPSPQVEVMPAQEPGSAAYGTIEIGSLLDDRIKMRSAIAVSMEQEGAFYIAKYDDINEMGYGTDPIGAVEDLRQTLAELYWSLKENRDRLGLDLADTWRKLSALVYEA